MHVILLYHPFFFLSPWPLSVGGKILQVLYKLPFRRSPKAYIEIIPAHQQQEAGGQYSQGLQGLQIIQ